MFVRLIGFLWIFPLNIQSLICPIYNLFNNETNSSLISSIDLQSNVRRCLGVYTFDQKLIRIRQLAFFDDYEKKYLNSTDCLLDIDRTGNNLLCRCNSDNCTLKWKTSQLIESQFSRTIQEIYRMDTNWFIPIGIVLTVLIILFCSILFIRRKHRHEKDVHLFYENISSVSTNISHAEIDVYLSSNPTYQSILHQSKTNTIYRALTNENQENKPIAIKLYHGQEYRNIFENELQILHLIHHSSISNFINYGWYNLSPYVIFEYYNLGSLENYLRSNKISWSIVYSFLFSLLNAIDYLHHEELSSTDYLTSNRIRKPIIIHRDIKSSNILVKSNPNPSLYLADFGLAKVLPTILTAKDFIQIGTYRYMAPELLELAITHTSDALCKVDMYAVGLVMWEIATQCEEYPCSIDYQLPYEEYLNKNETNENQILDILHRIVVHERKRPILHQTSNINFKISDLFNLIDDCWKHEPDSRLHARPALCRLRRLENLQ